MTQEEKQLLLKDLCARLLYDVQAEGLYEEYDDNDEIIQIKKCGVITCITHNIITIGINDDCKLGTVKPYLRPMSSMTEEEKKEFIHCAEYEVEESVNGRHYEYYLKDYVGTPEKPICNYNAIDWLNKHHFDYRGLIGKGLAVEAPEGMYNTKTE